MKHIANIITSLRVLFALAMLIVSPFSTAFWLCYLAAGLSDVLDGPVARVLNRQSDFGAKLDSLADFIFALVIAVILIRNVSIAAWLWVWVICIAATRFTSYAIGYKKYHCFSALHTYANKAAGGLVFLLPLLYKAVGMERSGAFLCAVATLAAVEELLITVKSKTLARDIKSIISDVK